MPPPYRPVGFCIYCGLAEAESGPKGLSDEHIIPYCLGGKDVLPKSSCEACAVITSAFEGKCATSIFAPARTHLHWVSRKRKKPSTSRAFVLSKKRAEAVDVPLDEDAGIVAMPELGPPPILFGRDYQGGLWQHGINLYFRPDSYEKLQSLSRKGIATTIMFDPDDFARTLAKIAHSYAVAELGYGFFHPYLQKSILHQEAKAGNFVGSLIGSSQHVPNLHEVQIIRLGVNIVVKIRLYASHNGPIYHVVAGHP